MTSLEKQKKVKEECKDKGFDALLVTTLDDIAWLTNCRGTDIDYNPVFFSYLLLRPGKEDEDPEVTLFVDSCKVEGIKDYLTSQNITTDEYASIQGLLSTLAETKTTKVGVTKSTCNAEIFDLLGEMAVDTSKNIIQHLKAAKNPTEQQGMRNCNVRDCAAIMKYFAYLEQEL